MLKAYFDHAKNVFMDGRFDFGNARVDRVVHPLGVRGDLDWLFPKLELRAESLLSRHAFGGDGIRRRADRPR